MKSDMQDRSLATLKISLHSFPPALSVTPHPALGYLKGYIESQNPNLKINSYYWNQKLIVDCFQDFKWLQKIHIDSDISASIFRSLFGYLFLKDLNKVEKADEGLDFLRTWGSFYCPNISKKDFIKMVERLDKFLNSEINQNRMTSYDIIGGSINLGQEIPSLMLLNRIKKINPSILTVFGGMSAQEGELLMKMFSFIDICVFGEGEQTLLEICESYPKGLQLDKIKGIVWKQDNGIIQVNPERNPLMDIDNKWANYEGYQWDVDKNFKMINIWDSRGCHWGKCTFCHRTSKVNVFRERLPEDILAEINHQLKTLNIQSNDRFMIRFLGSDVRGSSDERFLILLQELSRLKESYQKLTIFVELNPDYITEEMMKYLDNFEARIQFGFEQWNSRILRKMKKPHRIENAIYTLKLITKYPSVQVIGFNLLCGYPGETYNDVYQSFRTLIKMKYIMAPIYDRNRKNPIHMIPNPVSMNPCTPIGTEWPWENPLIEKMIDTSPLTKAFSYLSNEPIFARDFVKIHSYMTISNLQNTEFVQRDLLKKYEEILSSTKIEVAIAPSKEVTFRLMAHNQTREVLLNQTMLKILQITEKPVKFEKIQEKLQNIGPMIIKKIMSQLEEADLVFSDKNRYINTLPPHIQDQLNNLY